MKLIYRTLIVGLIFVILIILIVFGIYLKDSNNKNYTQTCVSTCNYFNLPYYAWDFEDSLFCYCIKDGLPHKILAIEEEKND